MKLNFMIVLKLSFMIVLKYLGLIEVNTWYHIHMDIPMSSFYTPLKLLYSQAGPGTAYGPFVIWDSLVTIVSSI